MDRVRATLRRLRPVALWGLGLLVAIQLVPYGRSHTNPPGSQDPPWPSERAAAIAERACVDCHSNDTRWPWYSHVAPASWLLTRDVEQGRDELNLSRWDEDQGEADDAVETILEGTMPPGRYILLHPDARLSDQEQRVLVEAFRRMDD